MADCCQTRVKMKLTTLNKVSHTNLNWPQDTLQSLPCGLHRASLSEAYYLLPELSDLYDSAPIENPDDWEIDIKIHMLMKGQFPCIPNWHCDHVPRNSSNNLRYDKIDDRIAPMFVWISNGPQTEFLPEDLNYFGTIENHGYLNSLLTEYEKNGIMEPTKMKPQTWYQMAQNTPHRGTSSDQYQWRVFARLTHKSILPDRPVISKIRRHAQVYLPHDFHW